MQVESVKIRNKIQVWKYMDCNTSHRLQEICLHESSQFTLSCNFNDKIYFLNIKQWTFKVLCVNDFHWVKACHVVCRDWISAGYHWRHWYRQTVSSIKWRCCTYCAVCLRLMLHVSYMYSYIFPRIERVVECAWAVLLFVVMLIYFPNKPKIPPTKTAAIPRIEFKNGLKKIIR